MPALPVISSVIRSNPSRQRQEQSGSKSIEQRLVGGAQASKCFLAMDTGAPFQTGFAELPPSSDILRVAGDRHRQSQRLHAKRLGHFNHDLPGHCERHARLQRLHFIDPHEDQGTAIHHRRDGG